MLNKNNFVKNPINGGTPPKDKKTKIIEIYKYLLVFKLYKSYKDFKLLLLNNIYTKFIIVKL